MMPEGTSVSLLVKKAGFEIVVQLADRGKQGSSHLWSICFQPLREAAIKHIDDNVFR
jgi:hypothetical protein